MTQEQNGMFGTQGTGDTSGYGGLVRQAAKLGSAERPYGSYFDQVTDDLERAYPDFSDAYFSKGFLEGRELTEAELDTLSNNFGVELNQAAHELFSRNQS